MHLAVAAAAFALMVLPAWAQQADCDRLASSPFDPNAPAAGVNLNDIDSAAAIPACEAAVVAEPDEPRHRFHLGRALEHEQRVAEAWPLYLGAADDGYVAAYNGAARGYAFGWGGETDIGKAVGLFEQGIAGGDVAAMFNLADLYYRTDSGIHDYAKSLELYAKAAALGDGYAMSQLGQQYEFGYGTEIDLPRAIELFRKAAELGNSLSLVKLGYYSSQGEGGLPQDYKAAFGYFQRAADLGHPSGFGNLGYVYETGVGGVVDVDFGRASELYLKAIEGKELPFLQFYTHNQVGPQVWVETERLLQEPNRIPFADGVPDEDTIRALARLAGEDPAEQVAEFRTYTGGPRVTESGPERSR